MTWRVVSFPLHKVASSQFTMDLETITSEVSSHGQNFIVMYNTRSTVHILVNVQVSLELLAGLGTPEFCQ